MESEKKVYFVYGDELYEGTIKSDNNDRCDIIVEKSQYGSPFIFKDVDKRLISLPRVNR